MCHSASSSIWNYGIVICIAAMIAYFGDAVDRHAAFAFAVLIHMQLSEYFMWRDQSCGWMNHFATYFAFVVLIVQPLAILLSGFWFRTTTLSMASAIGPATIFAGICLVQLISLLQKPGKRCSRPSPKHLVWDLDNTERTYIFLIPYLLMLIGSWAFLKDKIRGLFLFGMIGVSFIRHYLKYKNDWPSHWCYATRNGLIYYALFSIGVRVYKQMGKMPFGW